ncbi:MAG: energy-coupling factor transporter transmembrane protein EcfT, partial [Romboutsia sp.]|nr:energy-coupling factor transporter transmembrane protein EcfT [Romboutsia sp.]
MNEVMLEYSEIDSPIHRLTGATKLICLILWSLTSMLTYNTYVLAFMVIFSFVIFKISKVSF